MASADSYYEVADDLLFKARTLRVQAVSEPPRNRDRLRQRAAKLERAARLLQEEAER